MRFTQIVIEKVDVASRDLKRGRAVPEDALQAEDIATVGEERTRESVTQHVWRTREGEGRR